MTNKPERLPDQHRLSELEVRKLLERVVELDSVRSGDASIADLRRIVQELNLSPEAFDQAVTELSAKRLSPVAPAARKAEPEGRVSDWLRTGVILVVTYLVSYTELRGGVNDLSSMAALLLISSGGLTLFHRIRNTPKAFWADMLALWGSVAAAWLNTGGLWFPKQDQSGIVRDVMQTDLVAALIAGWFSCTTIGSWIIRKRFSWKKHPGSASEFAASR